MPPGFRVDAILKDNVDKLWCAALSANTMTAYRTGIQCLFTFLIMSGVIIKSGELPSISEELLIYFVSYCHTSLKLKWTTIKLYLSGVRFHYLRGGFSDPLQSADRLQCVLRGVKRTQIHRAKQRLPITINILHQICRLLKTGKFSVDINITLECMCILAFYGFLRCSEFTIQSLKSPSQYLRIKDVLFSNDKSMFTLVLASSKTDPFRKGVRIPFFRTKYLCPVACMWHYIVHYRQESPSSNAPLFLDLDKRPFSRDIFISYLRQSLSHLGYNQTNYCGHSFRIGAASTAAAAGIEDHMIKTLGRWSSSCYVRYIHIDPLLVKQAQGKLSVIK